MKYINFKRYKFSTVVKNFNRLIYNFLKIFKFIDVTRYDFKEFVKYFDPKKYGISRLKKINLINSKFLFLHLPASIIFFGFLYITIPTFYTYNKSDIENIICKNDNIECIIRGKINYRFYPTPRLIIRDLIVSGLSETKYKLLISDQAAIKLSFKNLLAKDKHKFTNIELNNFETKLNLENFKKYKKIFNAKINFVPIIFKNGKIIFYEGNNYVATISNINMKTKFIKDFVDVKLKGKFLKDNIFFNFKNQNIENKASKDLILKLSNLNFLAKINFTDSIKNKDVASGNFLIKKGKNKIAGIFDYQDHELSIKKSNLRNTFIDGKLVGKIILLPFFDFNLDLNLNSINFTKLYNYFLALDKKEQKDLFKINNKINGNINFSSDKVYSRHNLVNSFESRLKFYNGNINIERFLINLGKLGAADILGTISNDKKNTNFKFESNIFVDNEKKFLSKLGIYNKKDLPSNLFISGNFDLENIKTTFYEIYDQKKFNTEDINFIESEFNNLMLEDDFTNLFDFSKFKVFLKSVIDEKN